MSGTLAPDDVFLIALFDALKALLLKTDNAPMAEPLEAALAAWKAARGIA